MGLKIVLDKKTKESAHDWTQRIIHKAADSGLLVGAVGIYGNVLQVAPPLAIGEDEAHRSLDILESVLVKL